MRKLTHSQMAMCSALVILFAIVLSGCSNRGKSQHLERDLTRADSLLPPFPTSLQAVQKYDAPKAIQLYTRIAETTAAEPSDVLSVFGAECRLGTIYRDGIAVPQDYSRAAYWYKKGVDEGSPCGESYLGWMYQTGQGVPLDYARAASLYNQSAVQAGARPYLDGAGRVWSESLGKFSRQIIFPEAFRRTVNVADGDSWYQEPTDFGILAAENNLGWMYEQGLGVKKDYAKALSWFHVATYSGGNAAAEANSGIMFLKGWGVVPNANVARNWLMMAVNNETQQGLQDNIYRGAMQVIAAIDKSQGAHRPTNPVAGLVSNAGKITPSGSQRPQQQASASQGCSSSPVQTSSEANEGDQRYVATAASQLVDVRFTPPETRIVTDEEFGRLKQGLHYSPAVSTLAKCGSVTTTLLMALTDHSLELGFSGEEAAGPARVLLLHISKSHCRTSVTARSVPRSLWGFQVPRLVLMRSAP